MFHVQAQSGKILAMFLLALFLAACGGGSDGSSSTGNNGSTGANSSDGGSSSSGSSGSNTPTVDTASVASVTFPPGALPTGATVKVEKGTDAVMFDVFYDSVGGYGGDNPTPYYVRIAVGTVPPTSAATVVIPVPTGYSPPSGTQMTMFSLIKWRNEYEGLDYFEPQPATWDATAGTVTTTIDPEVFGPSFSGDGTVEAVLLLGTTPSVTASGQSVKAAAIGNYCENANELCPTGCMRTPLLRTLQSKQRASPLPHGHPGVDFRAETGTEAVAVGNGTLVQSYYSASQPGCQWPADCQPKGAGQTIMLDVPGVGTVRYLHLQSRNFPDCCSRSCGSHSDLPKCTVDGTAASAAIPVAEGQVVGDTDTTGYTTQPHLHFELYNAGKRLDAGPCILPPDYHGKFTNVTYIVQPEGTFKETVTARANFVWSQTAHKYQTDGTWTVNLDAIGEDSSGGKCVVTVTDESGTIGPDDGTLQLGWEMKGEEIVPNTLLNGLDGKGTPIPDSNINTGSYYLGSSIPSLSYLFGGYETNANVIVNYTCPKGSGTMTLTQIFWWPALLASPDWPFYARPNPWNGQDPYGDFVETDVPFLDPSLYPAGQVPLSSWEVSARRIPP